MMEVEPEPNIIIPFDPTDPEGVRRTFQMFGVVGRRHPYAGLPEGHGTLAAREAAPCLDSDRAGSQGQLLHHGVSDREDRVEPR